MSDPVEQTHTPAPVRRTPDGIEAERSAPVSEPSGPFREALALAAGVFIACSPFYGAHRPIRRGLARLLRLDPRKVDLGGRLWNPMLAPLLLLLELQVGAWLRSGELYALAIETIPTLDPVTFVLDVLAGWLAIGGIAAAMALVTTHAAVRDSSSDPWFATLVRRAGDRYLGGSITSWEFARAKLRIDPVFEEVLSRGLPRSGGTLIDIGCGQGVMLALLTEAMAAARTSDRPEEPVPPPRFRRLIGIETRANVARLAASALGSGARIVRGDARTAGFEPFSAALLFDVLQMMSREQQETLLSALREVMAPDGVILIREADASAGWRFSRVRIGNRLKALSDGDFRQTFAFRSADEWLACFHRLGFAAELRPLRGESSSANLLFRLSRPADSHGHAPSRQAHSISRAAVYTRSR
ncbi:MAG TPA: class I SAM-dependent methyltransferase [Thermoanaerobaculia bacterium]|nr:class I SAM-dependent methyltransferase [Thermoanaerobaculia bacterium]